MYCWCCDSILTTKGICPICDMPGMMSPPHICLKTGEILSDEHGCEPEFEGLTDDHETGNIKLHNLKS